MKTLLSRNKIALITCFFCYFGASTIALALLPPPCEQSTDSVTISRTMQITGTGSVSSPADCLSSLSTVNAALTGFSVFTASGIGCNRPDLPLEPKDFGTADLVFASATGSVCPVMPGGPPVPIGVTPDAGSLADSITAWGGYSRYASASVATPGQYDVITRVDGGFWDNSRNTYSIPPDCTYWGNHYSMTAVMPAASADSLWSLSESVSVDYQFQVYLEMSHIPTIVTLCGSSGTAGSTSLPVGYFRIEGEDKSNGATTSFGSIQGLFARKPDGTFVRLGEFSNPVFDPVVTGNQWSVSGTRTVSTTWNLATGVPNPAFRVMVKSQFWNGIVGDLNDDGSVDRCELIGWMSLYGAVFGSASYTPQCDPDLDGDIDAVDGGLAWEKLCRTDVNCDGSADSSDVIDLADYISTGAPFTDVNLDGSSDLSDINDLANAIAASQCM